MIALQNDDHEPAGSTLRDRLRACRDEGRDGIPAAELCGYLREVAAALDAMHAQGRLHLNVKPEAIRLTDGQAALADTGTGTDAAPVSGSALLAGTPAYMAPEMWQGNPGPRSDQYGLACVYAEMRLGRLPLPGADLAQLMNAHASGSPDLDKLPARERQALLRALAKDSGKRYVTCRSLVEELESAAVAR